MRIEYGTIRDKISLMLIWIVLFMAFPFSIPQAFNLPAKLIIGGGALILLIPLIYSLKSIKVNQTIIYIFLVQISCSILFFFLHKDTAYVNFFFQILVPMIIYLYIVNVLAYQKLSDSLLKLLSIMGVLSVICFFLCLIINLPAYSTFENPDGRTGYNFIISFTNAVFDIGFAKIIRPAGYFDEPGTLAFYLVIGLLINDMTVRSRLMRVIFIISGIFTLSIAFYIILFFHGILNFNKKKILRTCLIGLIAIIGCFALYGQLGSEQQDIIKGSTIGRLQSFIDPKSSPNYYQGDNRTELVEVSIQAISDSPLIGQGISYASKEGGAFYGTFMGANFIGMFGIHGVIGGIIFSLHIFYYIYVCFKKKIWLSVPQKCCLIYLLLILQKPDYIGGLLTYVSVILLTLVSLNYYNNVSENIDYNSSI